MKHIRIETMIQRAGSVSKLAKQVNLSESMIRTALTHVKQGRNYKVLVDESGNAVALEEKIGWRRVGWK